MLLLPWPPTVLIVDDDRVVRSVFRDSLRLEGYWVQAVDSGQHALALLKAMYATAVLYPACMILDMNLKDPEWEGIDTLANIALSGVPTPPTVLCSANIERTSDLVATGRALGVVAAIPKLEGLDVLHNAVARAIVAPRYRTV